MTEVFPTSSTGRSVAISRGPSGRAPTLGTTPVPVLFLIPSLDRGGAEGQLIMLINGLDRRRFAPLLCCLETVSPERRGEIRCDVVGLGITSLFRVSAVVGLLRLVTLIRHRGVRVVHAVFLRAEILAGLARLLDGRLKVILGKRDLEHYRYRWHERHLVRRVNSTCDAIVANAMAVRDRLVRTWGVSKDRVAVIRNGVDLERFVPVSRARRAHMKRELGLRETDCLAVMVTHLVPVKGVETLVDAAATLPREAPNARFVVLGGGPLLDALRERARAVAIGQAITFIGDVSDVVPYLAAADLGVLSSLSEGFPNAVLEYMAMGLPVVATAVGGVPELLGADGDCGYLVPAGAPAAIAERVALLMSDPDLRADMGRRGRLRIEALFGADRMVMEYGRLYDRLVSAAERP